MKRRKDLDNKDHDMAEYLFSRGWTESRKEGDENQFYNGAGELIATVVYDNRACRYEVFVK